MGNGNDEGIDRDEPLEHKPALPSDVDATADVLAGIMHDDVDGTGRVVPDAPTDRQPSRGADAAKSLLDRIAVLERENRLLKDKLVQYGRDIATLFSGVEKWATHEDLGRVEHRIAELVRADAEIGERIEVSRKDIGALNGWLEYFNSRLKAVDEFIASMTGSAS